MPQDIAKLPSTFVQTTKAVKSLVLRSTRFGPELVSGAGSAMARPAAILGSAAFSPPQRRRGFFLFLDELLAPFTDGEIFARFLVEAWDIVVANGARHHAPDSLGTEIIFRVEAVHPFHQLTAIEAGINGVGKLMAAGVGHAFDAHQAVLFGVLVKLRPGERMAERNLDGFNVQLFGELNGLTQSLARLAGKSHDEVAVNGQAQLVAVLGEALRHVDGGAFLDVLQDLLV